MAVRKFKVMQALSSFSALTEHLPSMTEEEVLAALDFEGSTRKRASVIDRLISKAARLNELSYVAKLKEKYHGSHPQSRSVPR